METDPPYIFRNMCAKLQQICETYLTYRRLGAQHKRTKGDSDEKHKRTPLCK